MVMTLAIAVDREAEAQAGPTGVLALNPTIVNALTHGGCAPACDLTDPSDLLAVADSDGDGDGEVELSDFQSLDVDANQLSENTGQLWVLAFVGNDNNVLMTADEGVFAASGTSSLDCSIQLADEDCDDDSVRGNGTVVATLL